MADYDLQSWAARRSDLLVTAEALAEGRRKAVLMWNSFPTDFEKKPSTTPPVYEPMLYSTEFDSSSMVDDAAFAFAVLNESARIDSEKVLLQGAGIEGDPSREIAQAAGEALLVVREYSKWISETKPSKAAANVGV